MTARWRQVGCEKDAGAMTAVGGMGYAYFRLVKYRHGGTNRRGDGGRGWGNCEFVPRAPFADELKTDWAKRVDRIARMVFAVLAVLVTALIIAYSLIAG